MLTWRKVILFAVGVGVLYTFGEGAAMALLRGRESWNSGDYLLVGMSGLLIGSLVK